MNVLITGCRRGIGYHLAKELSKKHLVYMTMHNEQDVIKNKHLEKENIKIFKLDITKQDDIDKIELLDIDVIINNAAKNISGSVAEADTDTLREIFDTNVFGTINLTNVVLKQMLRRGSGLVVNFSSIAGVIPFKFLGVYGASKASLSHMSACLDKEVKCLNKNVRVKYVDIGAYHTGFNQDMVENCTAKNESSPFYEQREQIMRDLSKFFKKTESKKVNKLAKKIAKIVNKNTSKTRYRTTFIGAVGARLYRIFIG